MKNKIISYYKKNVYGTDLLYIKDEALAKTLQKLIGTKTISPIQMALISELFEVDFVQVLN